MAPPSITPSLPPPSHLFTPIHEGNESEETEERHRFGSTTPSTTESIHHHNPTPLYQPGSKKPSRKNKPSPSNHHTVSCNNCRPTTREKTSVIVVPVDHHHNSLSSTSSPSPNRLFKSLISGISRRTPKLTSDPSKTPPYTEEQWRITVAELSLKLSQATRRRDEAILEASRLKYSMSELENKLNRLEIYCHNLQSGLEICNQAQAQAQTQSPVIVNSFLVTVSDARTSIRVLSKALSSQLKLMGVKVLERLSLVLKSYDFKIISSTSLTAHQNNIQYNKSLQYYLEAVLSRVFYHEFESSGFGSSMDQILNPTDRCEANYSAYNGLKDLTWDQVLNKGTKHFSEEFSGFCDRKMSEIVGLLGWTRAWPEKLLEAFFGASKSVWLVHLLANSVHPRLMIFRVEKGVRFDPVYMEDMGGGGGGDKAKKLIPTMVKIMVEPGFYVYDNVVKCKVISKYYNNSNSNYGSVFSGNDDV